MGYSPDELYPGDEYPEEEGGGYWDDGVYEGEYADEEGIYNEEEYTEAQPQVRTHPPLLPVWAVTLVIAYVLLFFPPGKKPDGAGVTAAKVQQSAPATNVLVLPFMSNAIPEDVETPVGEVEESGAVEYTECAVSPTFPEKVRRWCGLITFYANKRGLHPNLVAALILQESGGNPQAYSKDGAAGLMQVMPSDGIAAGFMCPAGACFANRPTTEKLNDPEFNIAYGTKMLANLYRRYGNIRDALKYYGPANVGYYYADIVLGHKARYGN